MTFPSGRPRRPDDWPSSHVRARTDLSDRLDGPLEPAEAEWLATHLAACADCTDTASAYAAQRVALHDLRERTPEPPRDLWARTAAAIESEARFRDTSRRSLGRRRPVLAPFAMLTAAVAVAVIVGTLTSSRGPDGVGTASATAGVALATGSAGVDQSSTPRATPLAVAQRVEWLRRGSGGEYRLQVANVDEVCPSDAVEPCDTAAPVEDREVSLNRNLSSVFGSEQGDTLIVFNKPELGDPGTVNVVPLASSGLQTPPPTPTPTPSVEVSSAPPQTPIPTRSLAPSTAPTASTRPASPTPSVPPVSSTPPSPSGDISPSLEPSPSVSVSPSPSGDSVEIARDVVLVGQSASYSASGAWFAFTARPADGSLGPDIYVWKVGEALATPITIDHRSTFGSWVGDTIVGSTVIDEQPGVGPAAVTELAPQSFLLDPLTHQVDPLAGAGRAWRPSVDPSGRKAVYWAGTLRATDEPGFAPEAGRLVLGSWSSLPTGVDTASPSPDPSGSPPAAEGPGASGLGDEQAAAHDEVTIAAGRLEDWDARWDTTGTHLAVWIADTADPTVGRLSLYGVSGFDGRIDLQKPLLDAQLATAGFAISDGQLVWAAPSTAGAVTGDRIQVLAWTDNGQGQVQTVSGPVVVIR
jgi:hypothetical protein